MRRLRAGLILVLLVMTACSGDDGGAGDATSGSADDAFGRAMAAQWTEGVTTVATSDAGGLTLETLSTRADAVTGGDVLLRIDGRAVTD
ncbi:MAG: hypothetical protein ABWZ14_02885, partial [Acidimicrobiales bacterium]